MKDKGQLFTAREAAQSLGVSYQTMKKWILQGKVPTVKTAGGHHRVALATLKGFLEGHQREQKSESQERRRRTSGNELPGKVVSIRFEGLVAEVVLVVGTCQVTASITAESVKEMQLAVGDSVLALIKSTAVMIERLDDEE